MGPRRFIWQQGLIVALLAVVIIHAVWGHLLPAQLARTLRRVAGHLFTVGAVRVDLPFRVVLAEASVRTARPDTVAGSQTITVVPQWVSWPQRTVWLKSVAFEGLTIRWRRNWEGKFEAPLPAVAAASTTSSSPASSTPASSAPPALPWTIVAQTVKIVDGTFEVVDEKTPQPFRTSLTGVSLVGGPFQFPAGSSRVSLAVQGRFVGHQGRGAPVYCSGWVNVDTRNLEVSCQLEPLPLAAFEPYYQGPIQVRVYDATLKATAKFSSKANGLDGRAQIEIGSLSEADLSFLGKTFADVKTLAGGSERSLSAEVQLSGPLDQPTGWKVQFVAGNEIVQSMLRPLFNRGIENVKIKVGQQTIQVGLTPASKEAATSIQEASKTVEEELKILAPEPVSPASAASGSVPAAQTSSESSSP